MTTQEQFRHIPQVEKLLSSEAILPYIHTLGHQNVSTIIRAELDAARKSIATGEIFSPDALIHRIVSQCRCRERERLQRVINGTGVMIHTNLGRAPLGEKIFDSMKRDLSGYCNLEYYIPTRKRGKRGGFAEELICQITGAEDALIVNNNASSVYLILKAFAEGRQAIVSRGELIQIGGGFRIPDIMEQTGAQMREVGTTNITTLADYRRAMNDDTAMILSAHRSNYRIEGFTDEPSLAELATLVNGTDTLLVRDLGSGNLVSDTRMPADFESTVTWELKQGADIISFSGDKLLGGAQAGIIIGKKEQIETLRRHPLMRMIRVDKLIYYILQETLLHYQNNRVEETELWSILLQDRTIVQKRIRSFLRRLKDHPIREYIQIIETRATYGGGSMPGRDFPSKGISVMIPGWSAREIHEHLIDLTPPVLGTVSNDTYIIDFSAIFERDLSVLVNHFRAFPLQREA